MVHEIIRQHLVFNVNPHWIRISGVFWTHHLGKHPPIKGKEISPSQISFIFRVYTSNCLRDIYWFVELNCEIRNCLSSKYSLDTKCLLISEILISRWCSLKDILDLPCSEVLSQEQPPCFNQTWFDGFSSSYARFYIQQSRELPEQLHSSAKTDQLGIQTHFP